MIKMNINNFKKKKGVKNLSILLESNKNLFFIEITIRRFGTFHAVLINKHIEKTSENVSALKLNL